MSSRAPMTWVREGAWPAGGRAGGRAGVEQPTNHATKTRTWMLAKWAAWPPSCASVVSAVRPDPRAPGVARDVKLVSHGTRVPSGLEKRWGEVGWGGVDEVGDGAGTAGEAGADGTARARRPRRHHPTLLHPPHRIQATPGQWQKPLGYLLPSGRSSRSRRMVDPANEMPSAECDWGMVWGWLGAAAGGKVARRIEGSTSSAPTARHSSTYRPHPSPANERAHTPTASSN